MKKNDQPSRKYLIIAGIILCLLSFLAILSASVSQETLLLDHQNGGEGEVLNPIGPTGAVIGYFLIQTFGRSILYVLLAFSFATGVLLMFRRRFWKRFLYILHYLILVLSVNMILIGTLNPNSWTHGDVPSYLFSLLESLFHSTGTVIISIAIAFYCLLFIVGFDRVLNSLEWFFRGLWFMLSGLIRLFWKLASLPFRSSPRPAVDLSGEMDQDSPEDDPPPPEITSPQSGNDAHEPAAPDPVPERQRNDPEFPITSHEDDQSVSGDQNKHSKVAIPDEDFEEYRIPDIQTFLKPPPPPSERDITASEEEIRETSRILIEKLAEFNITAKVVNVNIGPIITQYELEPAPGVKVSRFLSLQDDLALAVKAKNIRVQAPIPGRGYIGVEVPNTNRETIYLRDVLLSDEMKKVDKTLSVGLGKDITGKPVAADLTKMPHLLIAGATGSGKSVCINTLICSILLRQHPDDVRLVLIDPKRIELSGYEDIPHLIQNVVTDSEDALAALNWGVGEMERRYSLLQKYNVRDIQGYNRRINEKIRNGNNEDEEHPLPLILMIVDEFADLIMTAGRDIELPISRLAQMARAVGIHLILATQRPSTKVITGIIKANFPARIAFYVSSKVDSRVILDSNGAERLLGRGDMLFLPPGKAQSERIHGAFISDDEIESLVEYLRKMPKPDYQVKIITNEVHQIDDFSQEDDLFPEAARAVVSAGTASVSMLQRHFKIGYARAGRLVDLLERAGIIGPHVGSKSREVLVTSEDIVSYE